MDDLPSVTLQCKTCGADIATTDYPPWRWVHADDEVVIKGSKVLSVGKYDHVAVPDVIDVEEHVSHEIATVSNQPDNQRKDRWSAAWLPRRKT